MSLAGALKERLNAYRPIWEHVLFGLSMLGVLTVVHLYIQQGREFDRGCFGFAGLESGHMGFDCSSVLASGAGTFLGLSNTAWGFGFYLTIAVLTVAIFLVGAEIRSWLHGVRGVGIAGGAIYSGYLVYVQVAVIESLCALCLASAVIATLLLLVQGTILARHLHASASTMPTRLFKRNLTIYVYLAAITAVLVGADLTYFRALAPAEESRAVAQKEQFSGAACELDPKKDPVSDPSSLVSFDDITKGPADASVTVVEYFDPNCPHCKTFHETMKTLHRRGDRDERGRAADANRGEEVPQVDR